MAYTLYFISVLLFAGTYFYTRGILKTKNMWLESGLIFIPIIIMSELFRYFAVPHSFVVTLFIIVAGVVLGELLVQYKK